MFNFLKKRRKAISENKFSKLNSVSDAFYHGKYRECIEEAKPLFNNSDIEIRLNAQRFYGLANYRLKRYEEASRIFQEIAEETKNTDDWFNLMTAAIRNKQIELGEKAYEKFNHPQSVRGANQMLTYANVTYQLMIALQDAEVYDKSLEKLIVLKRYIAQAKEHNSEFLAKHGLPFIFQTLVSARTTLEQQYTNEQIERFLDDFEKHVDQDGKESIQEFRASLVK
ncbi:MAG: hypothetical protein JXR60_07790 [Bacteroidales bacterium]|nr:hypothetical protein [Bacteroidales bacterium]